MFYIGSGSITVESCSITEEALKAVNPGFVISGDSSHKTSVDFIIDIQYTEHDIGCYADPIELTGTFERIHFTFPDQEIKDNSKLKEIRASSVTVEVTDAATGVTVRRTLPIDYVETANGLRLIAEDSHGNPSELVFYSGFGLGKIRDLTGGGPDADPCGGHSGH